MKTVTVGKRLLSLLLTAIMITGILPLSLFASAAASPAVSEYSPWKLVGTDSKKTNAERYLELKNALETTDSSLTNTNYVRLDRDIKMDVDLSKNSDFTESSVTMVILGNVVLDLNGHTLKAKVYDGTGVYLDPVSLTMFEVGNGAKFTIVDSKGKGKIATDSWISEPKEDLACAGGINVFDMFKIDKGGEIIVNASGAEFECGRSKQQWVTRAYTVDKELGGVPDASYFFTGYIRGQACGSVFVTEGDSKITVAGGKFLARGYEFVYNRGYDIPCAVFNIGTNTVVDVIDGIFYGKGCADVFSTEGANDITVRSGVFDVFKVDKVPVLNDPYDRDPLSYNKLVRFSNGRYGAIGIPDSALDPDNSDIVIGGHNYSEDEDKDDSASDTHKTVTVKPKSNTKTPDDRILLENENGVSAWNGEGSYVINAKNGRAYFADGDREYLSNDVQTKTTGYYLWTFTLYDAETGEKCDAEPMQVARLSADDAVSIDLKDYKQTNTTSFSYYFENDKISSYKIKAEVEEVWLGQHTYRPKFYNWFYFNDYMNFIDINEAAEVFDFEVSPRTPRSVCTSYTLTTENEEGMEFYFDFMDRNSKGAVICNSYYRYCMVGTTGKTVLSPKQEIATGSEYGETVEFIVPPKHAGPVYVTVDYVFKRSIGSSYVGNTVTVSVTHLVYALDFMTYDVIKSDEVIKSGYVSVSWSSYDTLELGEGETAVIKPNISADMTKMDTVDPLTGKTFNKRDIKWEFSTGLDDDGKHIWNDVPTYEIVEYDIDGVTLPCVKTNRTAWYRISYVWNGKTYYSPQSLLIRGVSYENNRVATVIKSDNFTGIYGKGENLLYLDLNKDADWNAGGYSIDEIKVDVTQKPDGSEFAVAGKDAESFTAGHNGLIKLVNTDSFFRNEAGAATGMYTFRVRIKGTNADGTTYRVTATCDVWYSQQTTDLNIYVNGTSIYEHDAINVPYILPADTNLFYFTYDFYPLNTMGNGIDKNAVKWSSSDSSVLRIDEKTGDAIALTPGTVTVKCSWTDNDGVSHSSSAKVSVPIAGFELDKLNYSDYIGWSVPGVVSYIASVKSVWAYGGVKITSNTNRYMTVELTSYCGYGSGSTTFQDGKVEYNNNYRYGYTLKPNVNGGYVFPVTSESDDIDIDYYVDTSLLQCDGLDDGAILSAADYEATIEWNMPYSVHIDYSNKTYEVMYADSMYIRMYHVPVINDPTAVYLNEVNITVSEPAVGDNRYEGKTYNPMNEYLILNVSGVLEKSKNSSTHSYVSKLDMSNMRGTGKAYDDASSEETGALAIEYMSVWNTNADYSEWYKPTKTYENGIYVNDVLLRFDSDAVSDTNYYVSKDAKVYVNGRSIDYANVDYSDGESSVSFKYYFDVGEVETASEIEVSGINKPLQGEMPSDFEDCTVKVNGEATDSVYISKLIWFVDADSDGEYDEGEEAKTNYYSDGSYRGDSTLWYDGSFLAGVPYSLCVELQTSGVRLDPNVVVSFSGLEKTVVGKTSAQFTFPEDTVIRTVAIEALTTDSAEGKCLDPLKLSFSGRTSGFNLNWTYNEFTEYNDPSASVSEFIGDVICYSNNEIKLPAGKTWLRAMITPKEGFQMSTDFKLLVNGSDVCEEFAPGRSNIETYVHPGGIYMCCYMFTSPKQGSDVTVKVTDESGNSINAAKTVQLIESGMSEASYEVVIPTGTDSGTITGVVNGEYTVKVIADGYNITESKAKVADSDLSLTVKLKAKVTLSTLKGKITSSYNASDAVTVTLTKQGQSKPAYTQTVVGNSADYKFENVESGTYTLTVTKKGHYPSRTKITVEGEALTKNVTLSAITNTGILGDVNDDGNVNMKDILLIRKAVAGIVNLDEINQTNADMNSDDNINMKDILLLRKSVAGIIS